MAKILLLDDMLDLLEGELELIEECPLGYTVDGITNPEDLLPSLEAAAYDLIILDLHMQKKDGFQCLREIRAQNKKIPIIIYSGFLHENNSTALIESGASMLVSKPAPADLFLNAIKSLIDPASSTCLILEKGYIIKEVALDSVKDQIRRKIDSGLTSLQELAKAVSISQEYLNYLITRFNLTSRG
ncbi:MAG: response regulator [Candidatus Omnitrophica bacterium]|nr:response regulator [Candidatus Omnitrophota bacterium]